SAAKVSEQRLAVGGGRRVATRTQRAVFRRALRAELGQPLLFSGEIEGQHRIFALRRRRDIDPLAPDQARGTALAWQPDFPGDGFWFPPLGILARADAALPGGSAPIGPIRLRKFGQSQRQGQNGQRRGKANANSARARRTASESQRRIHDLEFTWRDNIE